MDLTRTPDESDRFVDDRKEEKGVLENVLSKSRWRPGLELQPGRQRLFFGKGEVLAYA